MATEKKLDCVILGLLSHEDLTGYEIKKRMDTALHYFWSASYGSIYPTLKELLEKKHVTVSQVDTGGRNKQLYSITPKGSAFLYQWLKKPVGKDELRYETLLKLFFGKEAGVKQTLIHIRAFENRIQKELLILRMAQQTLKMHLKEDSTHLYYLLTVDFGIKTYEAYMDWCKYAVGMLKGVQ